MLSSYTTYHFLVACSLKDGKLGYHLPACSGLPQLRFRCKLLCLRPFSHDMAKGSSEYRLQELIVHAGINYQVSPFFVS